MTRTLCAAVHCDRPVGAGFALCAACIAVARGELLALPGLYRDCESRLVHTPQGLVSRIGRSRPLGIGLDERTLRARADIVDILSSWCLLVTNGRGTGGPGSRAVDALVAFLDRNLGWLSGHEVAADFASEVGELAAAVREVADGTAGESRQLGPCGRPGCDQMVYVTLGGDRGQQVRCTAGHTWRPNEWLSLSRRMRPEEWVA